MAAVTLTKKVGFQAKALTPLGACFVFGVDVSGTGEQSKGILVPTTRSISSVS